MAQRPRNELSARSVESSGKAVDGTACWTEAQAVALARDTGTCSFVLEEGASAYSCIGRLNDSTVGILYERADRISFATLPLAVL